MKEYDIILVYSFGKGHYYYLNIIKHLSSQYKIGLLLSDEKNFAANPARGTRSFLELGETEKKFRAVCVKYGAEKIYVNQKNKCKLLLMHDYVYTEDYLIKFRKNISWDKLIGLFFLLGRVHRIEMLQELGAVKYFAPAKYLYELKAKCEGNFERLKGLDIVEAGLPYKKYPVFDKLNLDIDYLIAYPTSMHLRGKYKERYEFFKTLHSMLNKIDRNERIFIKSHNVKDKEILFQRKIIENVVLVKSGIKILDFCVKLLPNSFLKNKLYHCATLFRHCIIEKKYPSLETLTEYSNFNIELFLPYVRKGVLTGFSGVVFHALYYKLPVYNCDPQGESETFVSFGESYRIPYCNSNLSFDEKLYNRINEEFRNADMIKLIEKELV